MEPVKLACVVLILHQLHWFWSGSWRMVRVGRFFFGGGVVWKKKYEGKKKRVRMEPARRKEHMPPP